MFVSCTVLVVEGLMHTKICSKGSTISYYNNFFINYLTLCSEIRLVKRFIMY